MPQHRGLALRRQHPDDQAALQAVEHHEIARYGTLVAWAKLLGREDCAALLQSNLDEEIATDKKLTGLATSRVNPMTV